MTEAEMAILQGENTEQIRALAFRLVELCAEKDKTIEWQRTVIDNGVIVRSFAGDAKEVVGEIRDNASKAADNTVAIIDELAAWREWIENGGKSGTKKNDTRTQLLKDMRDAIWDKWQRYKDGDADCELPNGKLRTAKRSYEEFYEKYGTAIVYTSRKDGKMWTLKQLCRNIDELKTAIDSANKSAKRSAKKVPKRKTDKKIR